MSENSLQVFVEMKPSRRLSFRVLEESDFDFYFKVNSDAHVMKYAAMDAFITEDEARVCFEEVLTRQKDEDFGTLFIVMIKDTMTPIGIVEYFIETIHLYGGIYELGYFILPEFWGKGYATEMAGSMIDYLFENFNVHKITGSCHKDNKASEGIMTKLGMLQEGVLRKMRFKDRMWVDELRYGLLREEWEEKRKQ